jgi:hypothetical protein
MPSADIDIKPVLCAGKQPVENHVLEVEAVRVKRAGIQ